ncbi:exodeoxyribonuclease VII small subunit [Helicobacter valdiviensis]|uniref:Exodeoxyribonuclease VII small subunit n=1 Tax=Helicobacter valdiviensis TaxID=1458358 RepID=A0A2W6N099_9HELI|nr:exodeoxyribonuclease VII small subunit [Helicobacter valdiviensis]PZT49138.1 exodeoxyribonuclease VII small subunit [Helicobacter valdiviensis]
MENKADIKNFESNIEKLKGFLENLEDENITLEKSLEIYKKSKMLLKENQIMLENAKLECVEITKQLEEE